MRGEEDDHIGLKLVDGVVQLFLVELDLLVGQGQQVVGAAVDDRDLGPVGQNEPVQVGQQVGIVAAADAVVESGDLGSHVGDKSGPHAEVGGAVEDDLARVELARVVGAALGGLDLISGIVVGGGGLQRPADVIGGVFLDYRAVGVGGIYTFRIRRPAVEDVVGGAEQEIEGIKHVVHVDGGALGNMDRGPGAAVIEVEHYRNGAVIGVVVSGQGYVGRAGYLIFDLAALGADADLDQVLCVVHPVAELVGGSGLLIGVGKAAGGAGLGDCYGPADALGLDGGAVLMLMSLGVLALADEGYLVDQHGGAGLGGQITAGIDGHGPDGGHTLVDGLGYQVVFSAAGIAAAEAVAAHGDAEVVVGLEGHVDPALEAFGHSHAAAAEVVAGLDPLVGLRVVVVAVYAVVIGSEAVARGGHEGIEGGVAVFIDGIKSDGHAYLAVRARLQAGQVGVEHYALAAVHVEVIVGREGQQSLSGFAGAAGHQRESIAGSSADLGVTVLKRQGVIGRVNAVYDIRRVVFKVERGLHFHKRA